MDKPANQKTVDKAWIEQWKAKHFPGFTNEQIKAKLVALKSEAEKLLQKHGL